MALGGLNSNRTSNQMESYKKNYSKYSNVKRGAFMVVLVSIFAILSGITLKHTIVKVTEIAQHMGGVAGEMSDALDEFTWAMKPVQEMLEVSSRRRLQGENPNRRLVAQADIDSYAATLSSYASDPDNANIAQAQVFVNQGMDLGLSMSQLSSTLSPLVAERVTESATALFASFCATVDRQLGFSIGTGAIDSIQDVVASAKSYAENAVQEAKEAADTATSMPAAYQTQALELSNEAKNAADAYATEAKTSAEQLEADAKQAGAHYTELASDTATDAKELAAARVDQGNAEAMAKEAASTLESAVKSKADASDIAKKAQATMDLTNTKVDNAATQAAAAKATAESTAADYQAKGDDYVDEAKTAATDYKAEAKGDLDDAKTAAGGELDEASATAADAQATAKSTAVEYKTAATADASDALGAAEDKLVTATTAVTAATADAESTATDAKDDAESTAADYTASAESTAAAYKDAADDYSVKAEAYATAAAEDKADEASHHYVDGIPGSRRLYIEAPDIPTDNEIHESLESTRDAIIDAAKKPTESTSAEIDAVISENYHDKFKASTKVVVEQTKRMNAQEIEAKHQAVEEAKNRAEEQGYDIEAAGKEAEIKVVAGVSQRPDGAVEAAQKQEVADARASWATKKDAMKTQLVKYSSQLSHAMLDNIQKIMTKVLDMAAQAVGMMEKCRSMSGKVMPAGGEVDTSAMDGELAESISVIATKIQSLIETLQALSPDFADKSASDVKKAVAAATGERRMTAAGHRRSLVDTNLGYSAQMLTNSVDMCTELAALLKKLSVTIGPAAVKFGGYGQKAAIGSIFIGMLVVALVYIYCVEMHNYRVEADKNNDGVIDNPTETDFVFLNTMHFYYYFMFFLTDIYIILEFVLAFISWALAGIIVGLTFGCKASKSYLTPRIDDGSAYWDMCSEAESAMVGVAGFVAAVFISTLLSWHILPMLQDGYAKYNISQSGANWKNGLKMLINRMTCGLLFKHAHSLEKNQLTWVSSTDKATPTTTVAKAADGSML
jgi:hypothetical protein